MKVELIRKKAVFNVEMHGTRYRVTIDENAADPPGRGVTVEDEYGNPFTFRLDKSHKHARLSRIARLYAETVDHVRNP